MSIGGKHFRATTNEVKGGNRMAALLRGIFNPTCQMGKDVQRGTRLGNMLASWRKTFASTELPQVPISDMRFRRRP